MKLDLIFTGITILFLIIISGTFANAADDWSMTISGPDGKLMVDKTKIDALIQEYGVSVKIEDESKTGVPLWRVLRLADLKKTLGPGDIIEIKGESEYKIPYPVVYKNNAYLLIVTDGGPYLYAGPDTRVLSMKGIRSFEISNTDDWILTLVSKGEKKEITREIWNDLIRESGKEKTDDKGRVFSGIPIYSLVEDHDIKPAIGSNLTITGQDQYSVEIPWTKISGNTDYLLADKMNGEILPKFIEISAEYGNTPSWPLILIDPDFPGVYSVGNVAEIKILN